MGYSDLKPCSFPRRSGLLYRYISNAEDLPNKEQPKSGVLPNTLLKYLILLIKGDTNPVILPDKNKALVILMSRDPDLTHLQAVSDRVVKEIEKNPAYHDIGK